MLSDANGSKAISTFDPNSLNASPYAAPPISFKQHHAEWRL
jgi:hypothetical protein